MTYPRNPLKEKMKKKTHVRLTAILLLAVNRAVLMQLQKIVISGVDI